MTSPDLHREATILDCVVAVLCIVIVALIYAGVIP